VSSPGRRPRVLALTELVPQLRARLESVCELTVRPAGELTDAEVAARVPGFDGLLSLLTHRVGKATFAAGRLVIVANCAVGVDNIDLAAARAAGVVVTHTPGVLTEDTADLTWALILAVTRRVAEGDRFVRSGRFAGWRVDLLLGRSLASLTLGVVGAGRIGRAVLARAAAFSMRRLYASRTALPPQVERELGAERRPLSELLAQADVVSLHVPLTDETRHLLNARALARMKPGAYLINTSRGSVVDEAALAVALDRRRGGRLGGAGLDVYEHEPRVHPELLELPNVVLLPHVGSATRETRLRMTELCVEDLQTALVNRRRPERALTEGRLKGKR
jgi:glyoxylate reductase